MTDWMLPLLLYSGPLLTYGAVVILYPTAKRRRFYRRSTILHASMFLPFVLLMILGDQDAVHSLILPAATGAGLFCYGAAYLLWVSIKTKRKQA